MSLPPFKLGIKLCTKRSIAGKCRTGFKHVLLLISLLLSQGSVAEVTGLIGDGLTANSLPSYGVVSPEVEAPNIRLSLLSERAAIVPGQTLQLALRLMPDEGWHTYWKNPGDTGLPTRLIWDLPAGFRAGDIEWPIPERIDFQGATNFGYHGETWLLTSLSVPAVIDPAVIVNGHIEINTTAKWLICKDVCIPGQAELSLTLPVLMPTQAGENKASIDAANSSQANISIDEWLQKFALARSKVPALVYDIDASFDIDFVGDSVLIQVDLNKLPTFQRPPQVFIGHKGIVDNNSAIKVSIDQDKLIVMAKKDAYLDQAPNFMSVVLVNLMDDGRQYTALEFVARPDDSIAAATNSVVKPLSDMPLAVIDQSADPGLLYVLLLAIGGGLILNAMPCVFPVLSLKIVSLVEGGNHSAKLRRMHGLAYAAGVILSFLIIAAILISLRLAGEQVGWGFQLQSPWFIAFLIYLLFVLGLSLSGFIELGTRLQNLGSGLASNSRSANDWRGSFFTGVLATVVATPCTAPFMGTAMGFALGQSVLVALLVFGFMGFGLALPFLLIAFIPQLANALPKPGNWMVQLKEFLAFPIYLTVIWLIWVLSNQTGSDAVIMILVGLVLITLALWIWRLTQYRDRSWIASGFVLLSVVAAIAVATMAVRVDRVTIAVTEAHSNNGFVQASYSAERLEQALNKGEPVFVNMTADWCITCKVNERVALATDDVKSAFAEHSIVYLKGDWTNSDAAITDYLARFKRNGVPLYVYYAPDKAPVILPQILTPNIVLDAIR